MKTNTKNKVAPSVDVSRLFRLLGLLDAAIPECEGAVFMKLFSDLSGSFKVEMCGVVVAEGDFGKEIMTYRGRVLATYPDRLPDVERLVERLNAILANNSFGGADGCKNSNGETHEKM